MHLMRDKIPTFCLKQNFILKVPTANEDGDFLTRLRCSQHLSTSHSADSHLIAGLANTHIFLCVLV